MNKTTFGHVQYHIHMQNIAFYRDLFTFLGWTVWYDDPNMLGMGNEQGSSVWFSNLLKEHANDYDGVGLNHLCISVGTQAEVDETVDYLKAHNIPALFETPRHRPEFAGNPEKTYYQVMFESPDRLLFEVAYAGPLAH